MGGGLVSRQMMQARSSVAMSIQAGGSSAVLVFSRNKTTPGDKRASGPPAATARWMQPDAQRTEEEGQPIKSCLETKSGHFHTLLDCIRILTRLDTR